ncbi:hypothetical protein Tco_1262771 [Tanacetum coccineum]
MVESSKKKKVKKFDFVTEGGEHVHFTAEKIEEQKRIEESLKAKLAKQEVKKVKNNLVDLLAIDVVKKRGLITLKVYREDETAEVIPNFKTSDLHLAEWREVVQACSNRKGKGWKTIYEQIKTRMDYVHHTKEELKIDFNKPLEEQDPLDELNDLANKKRKRVDDFHDYRQPRNSSHQFKDFEDLSNEILYGVQEFIKDPALMIMPEPLVPFYLLK